MTLHGEKARRAVRWISDTIKDSESSNINSLIHQAISKFDLDPKQSEELIQFYQQSQDN